MNATQKDMGTSARASAGFVGATNSLTALARI